MNEFLIACLAIVFLSNPATAADDSALFADPTPAKFFANNELHKKFESPGMPL